MTTPDMTLEEMLPIVGVAVIGTTVLTSVAYASERRTMLAAALIDDRSGRTVTTICCFIIGFYFLWGSFAVAVSNEAQEQFARAAGTIGGTVFYLIGAGLPAIAQYRRQQEGRPEQSSHVMLFFMIFMTVLFVLSLEGHAVAALFSKVPAYKFVSAVMGVFVIALLSELYELRQAKKKNEATKRVQITCPSCHVGLRVPAGRVGTVECPKCGSRVQADTRTNRSAKETPYGAPLTAPGSSYFARHWQGDLSLGKSYWVNGIVMGMLAEIIWLVGLNMIRLSAPGGGPGQAIPASLLFVVRVGVYVWQVVGTWRSAGHHVEQGGKKVWAILARISVGIGVVIATINVIQTLGAIGTLLTHRGYNIYYR